MTNCHPIVEELAASVKTHEVPSIAFATSVLRGLRRTLEEITGAVDAVEAGSNVENECPAQRNAYESGHAHHDESTGLPLDPKMVADAVKEEFAFMRWLQVYHKVPGSYRDESGLRPIGTRWIYTNEGDAASPCVRARLVARETKRVSKWTPEDASSTFAATPLESLKFMLSRCMTGDRRAPADTKSWDSTTSGEHTCTAKRGARWLSKFHVMTTSARAAPSVHRSGSMPSICWRSGREV